MAKTKEQAEVVNLQPETDVLVETASKTENLDREGAISLAHVLIDRGEQSAFELGGVLSVIQAEGWWQESHESFKDFIEAEMGMKYRKAMYLIEIYMALVNSGVQWGQVKSIGWTKLRLLASTITPDNVATYVKMASEMTVIQLEEYLKSLAQENIEDGAPETEKSTLSSMTFKVHSDQKELIRAALDKAKEEFGTEFDAVALDHMSQMYIESGLGKTVKETVKQESLEDLFKKHTYEEVLSAFEKVWPEISVMVEV